jgi:hypothetical protein
LASKAARRGIKTEDRLITAINFKDKLGEQIINFLQNYFKTTYGQVSARKAEARGKADIIISRDNMKIRLSVKEYDVKADYNHLERNFVEYYSQRWQMPREVYRGLKQFVGEVDDYGRPISIDVIEQEAKQAGTSPGKLTKERRKLLNQLEPRTREAIFEFFESNKEKIVKDVFVGEEDIEFFVIARRCGKQICYYILPTKEVLSIYTQGAVKITARGSLQIGKVVLQRKSGDHRTPSGWVDRAASQLQFKIKPSECVSSREPIFCEILEES